MIIKPLQGEVDKSPVRVKHMCNAGDVIATLAAMKSFYTQTGKKIIFCQQLNVEAAYYPGAQHETRNELGVMVCMNSNIWGMIKPLLLSQEYIHDVEEYQGQEIFIDIDVIRKKMFVNLPHGPIQSWAYQAYPDLVWPLSKPWITLPENGIPGLEEIKDKIIVNFTERYRNGHINYFFLKKYKNQLLFAGTPKEHLMFVNKWKVDLPLLEVKDFLELAYAIKNCKFILSNQSMCWNISAALGSPHVLEMCEFAVNCIPFVYEGSCGHLHQEGIEHYCDVLANK